MRKAIAIVVAVFALFFPGKTGESAQLQTVAIQKNTAYKRSTKAVGTGISILNAVTKTSYSITEPAGEEKQAKEVAPEFAIQIQEHRLLRDKRIVQSDIEELARIVWWEARGQSMEGKIAVANVVLNRASYWNASIHEIIWSPGQFTPTENSRYYEVAVSSDCYEAAQRALNGESVVCCKNVLYFMVGISPYMKDVFYFEGHHYGHREGCKKK